MSEEIWNRSSYFYLVLRQEITRGNGLIGGTVQSNDNKRRERDIIMSGWNSDGIPQEIRTGSANLESLDPSSDIDPLIS